MHDLHVWNVGAEDVSLSAHVVLTANGFLHQPMVMESIRDLLAGEYGITHTTLQFEESHCGGGHGGCN